MKPFTSPQFNTPKFQSPQYMNPQFQSPQFMNPQLWSHIQQETKILVLEVLKMPLIVSSQNEEIQSKTATMEMEMLETTTVKTMDKIMEITKELSSQKSPSLILATL